MDATLVPSGDTGYKAAFFTNRFTLFERFLWLLDVFANIIAFCHVKAAATCCECVCVDFMYVSKMRQLKIDCSLKLWVCYATVQHTWTLWAFSISKYLKPIVIYTSIKTTSAKRLVFFFVSFWVAYFSAGGNFYGWCYQITWIVVGECRRVWD